MVRLPSGSVHIRIYIAFVSPYFLPFSACNGASRSWAGKAKGAVKRSGETHIRTRTHAAAADFTRVVMATRTEIVYEIGFVLGISKLRFLRQVVGGRNLIVKLLGNV